MSSAPDAYFGWSQPGHLQGCARPKWEVDTRSDYDAWRGRSEGVDHRCPDEDCGHHNRFTSLTVRVICRCCGVAHVFQGESHSLAGTTTRHLGYGQPPRKLAGLWLYPGSPLLYHEDEPYDYLCALQQVERLEPEHVVGEIAQGRGSRGALLWGAAALPEINGTPHRPALTYTVHSGDQTFKTVAAAAKWIGAHARAAQVGTRQ